MCAFMVVRVDPRVKILLHRLERRVDLLAECDLIELVEDGLMEAFADAIRLR